MLRERMSEMKAFVHEYGELKIKDVDEPVARDGEVVVSLNTAGLKRRALNVRHGHSDELDALIRSTDGAGGADTIGNGKAHWFAGALVIPNAALHGGKKIGAPPEDFAILRMPDEGTF